MANGGEGEASSWIALALHGAGVLFGILVGIWGAAWGMADRFRTREDNLTKLIRELEKREIEERAALIARLETMIKDMSTDMMMLHRENIKRHDAMREQLGNFDRAIGRIEGREEGAERRRRERTDD